MARKKNDKMLRGEKLLYLLIGFLVLGNIFGTSFSSALLSKTNIEVESIRKKIDKQENINQSLEMKISELASFDNVEAVATTYGLEYNNSNVRTINE
jgi:cell division protein FtsL